MTRGVEFQRRRLEGRLHRIRRSYEWGDKPEAEYLRERRQIKRDLSQFEQPHGSLALLDHLATYLKDLAAAWAVADQANRNRLARQVFNAVIVRNETVVAVMPRPELRAFFALNEEARHIGSLSGDPDGIQGLKTDFKVDIVAPRLNAEGNRRYMVSTSRRVDQKLLRALRQRSPDSSLRELASLHGVSHETIRRALFVVEGSGVGPLRRR